MGSFLIAVALLALCLGLLTRGRKERLGVPLPPGPTGLPIIGSLHQAPLKLLFLKLDEWSKRYGPLFSYSVMGQRIVVIAGAKEANDLLDHMSASTGDRPPSIKANEYLCRHMEFGFHPRNDPFWRTQRRAAHESLNVRAANAFRPMQAKETRILLEGLIEHPEIDIIRHLYRHSASIAWRSLYGRESLPLIGDDPTAPMFEFFTQVILAAVPGGSIVDIFPFLRPVISRSKWLRKQSDRLYLQATEFFVKAHSDPQVEGSWSMSSKLKEMGQYIGMASPVDCGWLGGTLFLAAQDTTATALRWFFVAMLCYPETAAAARAELDAVVGDRLPTCDDRDRLPQVEAMVKEVLRWRPPTPAGVPHAAEEDINYNGFLIPQGAILIALTWTIGREPGLYDDGDRFDPSRFIDTNGRVKQPKPHTHDDYLVFGHGRRICVGKSLALNTMWISVAQLLWAFDFHRVKDEHGKELVPDPMAFWDNGATVWPMPFRYRLVPRFPDLAERLKGTFEEPGFPFQVV